MTKNENRKMNPLFFLFQKSKTKTSGKQAEQKSPSTSSAKFFFTFSSSVSKIFSASKKLMDIFIFSFWDFLSFSENGGQPGAAPEGREADFL